MNMTIKQKAESSSMKMHKIWKCGAVMIPVSGQCIYIEEVHEELDMIFSGAE